jgi:hypothetical protein
MDQNNEITGQLIDVFNNRRRQPPTLNNSRTYNYTRNPNNNRNRPNQMRENVNNNNNNNNQRRVYIDNIPYYVDDLQLFTFPNSTTNAANSTASTNANANVNISNQFSRILNSFLQPINVTPTQSQIENATRNIVYGEILDPINNSCPISLEPFTDTSNVTMIRHCRHIFNNSSLMSWFNSNCKCPVCRYDIRNYNPDDNNNNNQQERGQENEQQNEQENEGEEIDSVNNPQTNQQNRLNTNTTNLNNNSIETLFVEILSDLSNNNIEYTIDNTSQLFNSLFSLNRRRESRR